MLCLLGAGGEGGSDVVQRKRPLRFVMLAGSAPILAWGARHVMPANAVCGSWLEEGRAEMSAAGFRRRLALLPGAE